MSNSISKRKPFKIYDFPRLIKGDLIKLNPNFHHHHFQRFINHVGIVEKSLELGMVWIWFMEKGRMGSYVLQREKILKIS
jgi:hypothetical protein